jgi:hypothetical protein
MKRLDVSAQTWRDSFLGTVTLSGTARRDGTLANIRMETMSGGADFAAVARDLAKSLESWKVDPGKDDDQFQVTVTYKFGGLPDLAVLEVTPSGITVIHGNQGIRRR